MPQLTAAKSVPFVYDVLFFMRQRQRLSRSAKVSAVLHVDEQVKNERDGGSVDGERIVHRPIFRRCNLPLELIRLGQLTGQHQRIVAGFVENDNPTG